MPLSKNKEVLSNKELADKFNRKVKLKEKLYFLRELIDEPEPAKVTPPEKERDCKGFDESLSPAKGNPEEKTKTSGKDKRKGIKRL